MDGPSFVDNFPVLYSCSMMFFRIRSGITTGGMTKAPAGDTVHTSGTHGAMSYSFQGEEDVQFPDDMEFPGNKCFGHFSTVPVS